MRNEIYYRLKLAQLKHNLVSGRIKDDIWNLIYCSNISLKWMNNYALHRILKCNAQHLTQTFRVIHSTRVPVPLYKIWWHLGKCALGKSRSSCEEGDQVAPFTDVVSGLLTNPKLYVAFSTIPTPTPMLGLFAKKNLVYYDNNYKLINGKGI